MAGNEIRRKGSKSGEANRMPPPGKRLDRKNANPSPAQRILGAVAVHERKGGRGS